MKRYDRFKKTREKRKSEGLCIRCKIALEDKTFVKCPQCRKEATKSGKKSRTKLRKKFFAIYGGKCKCCGENKYEFLNLDHINGGGTKDVAKRGAYGIYQCVVTTYQPERYRILCWNCNMCIGHYGYCAHKKEDPSKS